MRLKELRTQRHMLQKDVAQRLGIDRTTYAKYESGASEPNHETLLKLSELFDVSADYLLGRELSPNVSPASHALRVPVLGVIQAGVPMDAIEDILDWEEVPASWGSGGREYFGLRVKGDSMYPRLFDGDKVLVLRTESVDSGKTAVVVFNGDEATVKRVEYREGEDWLDLVPANPAYPRKHIMGADLALCRVVGEVKALIRTDF